MSRPRAQCVADIIAAGIIPGGMEMMDRPAIHAAEAFVHAGYPLDVEALLIVELDGPPVEVDDTDRPRRGHRAAHAARRPCQSRPARQSGCCSGPGARPRSRRSGGSSPDYLCMDGTIPRRQLPLRAARASRELSAQYGLRVANVFHAGDGNLHPLILYDANEPGELDKAEALRRRHPAAVRRGRRRADRRARRRRREARPDVRDVRRRSTSTSSSG